MRNFQSEEHLCLYRQQAFNFLVFYSPMIFKREEFYSYSLYVIWRTTPNHTFNSQSTIPMMMLGPRITISILFFCSVNAWCSCTWYRFSSVGERGTFPWVVEFQKISVHFLFGPSFGQQEEEEQQKKNVCGNFIIFNL